MKNIGYLLITSLLAACATTSSEFDNVAMIEATTPLSIESTSDLNRATKLKRGEILLYLNVQPNNVVKVVSEKKVSVEDGGFFHVDDGDFLFAMQRENDDLVYCGYSDHHRNSIKTKLSQACFSDSNNDGNFDKYYSRVGPSQKDMSGFVYYDTELVEKFAKPDAPTISYITSTSQPHLSNTIAFRYKEMKKKKGVRTAVFDILSKKEGSDEWHLFPIRDQLLVPFDPKTNETVFKTSLFSAILSKANNNSFVAQIDKIEILGDFGYKSVQKVEPNSRYFPAYQITGY